MGKRRYFGTDGIRGRVGQGAITPEFVMKLGWAVGKVLAGDGGSVVIGKDTRLSGYMFESALEAGLSAAGSDIILLGPMATPAIAYFTRNFRAKAGIVISASHNPFHDNGIKFFSAEGMKLPDELEQAIEAKLDEPMSIVAPEKLGRARRVDDAVGRYVEFCKGTFPTDLTLKDMKIVLDCANGATYNTAPKVFTELGAELVELSVQPDGLNINLQCGATDLNNLQQTVLEQKADVGIALDGDGDRVMMVDRNGDIVDGDELLFIIASYRHKKGTLYGSGVVGTLMTNYGIELAYKAQGIDFVRAQVGDRYVMEQLLEHGWSFGGESSGHIICLNKTTTGAGIIAALQVLNVMQRVDKDLVELKAPIQKMPQVMVNVEANNKERIMGNADLQQAMRQAEIELGNQGRVLLRPSGTEPVIRVMVEATTYVLAQKYVELLVSQVKNLR